MHFLKVIPIGDSLGVMLPDEVVSDLHVREGDELVLSSAPGGYRLMGADPELRSQLEAARRVMSKRSGALRDLAKR